MTWFGIKWPEKGWYTLNQNYQPSMVQRLINIYDSKEIF